MFLQFSAIHCILFAAYAITSKTYLQPAVSSLVPWVILESQEAYGCPEIGFVLPNRGGRNRLRFLTFAESLVDRATLRL
jgi:hypothetical protein